jgi:hypothetical protein
MANGKSFYGYSLNQEQIEVAAGEVMQEIARHLTNKSGEWFGVLDVHNCLLLALRSMEATRAIVLWNPRSDITAAPGALFEVWAARLNALAESDRATPSALRRAVSAALMGCYGFGGGSLLVFRDGWKLTIHPLAYDSNAPVILSVLRDATRLPEAN